ncbi:MAG: MmcQ/YjbR family DNA-binding protein [Motiliproteus sp.]
MELTQLSDYCCSLPAVTTAEIGTPGNIFRFKVDKQTFAYYKTSDPQRGRFSLRVDAERFWELTDQENTPYPIQPARYMARFHWITIIDVAAIPESWLQDWLLGSYRQALSRLSKKRQRQLLDQLPLTPSPAATHN